MSTVSNAKAGPTPAATPIDTVFFTRVPWQTTSRNARHFAWGWYPDVLVASPYAFQVQIRGDLFRSTFELRNANGAIVPIQQARANRHRDCGSPGSEMRCFLSPGDADYVVPPSMPRDVGSYSLQLETLCDGTPSYTRTNCVGSARSEPGLLLTINPPTEPAIPEHGQTFEYTLSWTNSVGTATRKVKSVYVEEGRCRILSLNAGPELTKAYENRAVQWFVENCYSMNVQVFKNFSGGTYFGGPTQPPPPSPLATLVTQTTVPRSAASTPNFNGEGKFMVQPDLRLKVSLLAIDAMGREQSTSKLLKIDPCTISVTHQECPTRCRATPPPSDCPKPAPQACPNNPDGREIEYTFDVLCNQGGGTALYDQRSMTGCTEAEAKAALAAGLTPNCGVIKLTGRPQQPSPDDPNPECLPPGTKKVTKDFCLNCSEQTGPVDVTTTGTGCSISEAEDDARAQRQTQACTVLYEGKCK